MSNRTKTKAELINRIQYLEDTIARYKDTVDALNERIEELEQLIDSGNDSGVSQREWRYADRKDLKIEVIENLIKLVA